MAEIKDSPEKNYRISLTEIASIFALVFAVFPAITYSFAAQGWLAYLYEMKLDSYQFPLHANDVKILGSYFGSLFLVAAGVFLLIFLMIIYFRKLFALKWTNRLRSKNVEEQEKINEENINSMPAHREKNVLDELDVVISRVLPATIALIILYIISLAFIFHYSRGIAQDTLEEINNSTTRLSKIAFVLEDGQIYCPPGVRIICSERFCGFNDGTNSTVVSLERVRSIQTELPAECPAAPPGSEAKIAATLLF